MLTYDSILMKYDNLSKLFVLTIYGLLLLFGFRSVPRFTIQLLPFWIVFFVILYGILIGLFYNTPINALNDGSSYFPLLLIFIIPNLKIKDTMELIMKFIYILLIILSIKFILNQFFSILIWGTPSWKLLFKQSPVLLVAYSILLNSYFNQTSIKKVVLIFLTLFFLVIAISRMIFICLIFITVIQIILNLNRRILFKTFFLFCIFLLSFTLYFYTQQSEKESIFSNLYGGTNYVNGVDYRVTQFNILINRFITYPFTGVGFGAVTKGYETYEELSKPYQLELDLINFFSKIGLIFSIIYLYSYYILHKTISKLKDRLSRKFYISFEIGIISLLIYSLGQTGHQGYIYWVVYTMFYSFLIIQIKNQC